MVVVFCGIGFARCSRCLLVVDVLLILVFNDVLRRFRSELVFVLMLFMVFRGFATLTPPPQLRNSTGGGGLWEQRLEYGED